jgi:hypothetical protein
MWRVNEMFDYASGGGRSQTVRVAAEVNGGPGGHTRDEGICVTMAAKIGAALRPSGAVGAPIAGSTRRALKRCGCTDRRLMTADRSPLPE